ncbi:MAG: hypothetical protein ACK4IX_08720 [Candidatus Sericytochromatia bacterium]
MNSTIRKYIYFIAIPVIIQSCSSDISQVKPLSNKNSTTISNNHVTKLSSQEIKDLDKEYSAFNTKALSESYISRKLSKFVSTNNSSKLIKEIYYLAFKQKTSTFNVLNNNSTLLQQVNTLSGILSEKNISEDFASVFPDAPPNCSNSLDKLSLLNTKFNQNIQSPIASLLSTLQSQESDLNNDYYNLTNSNLNFGANLNINKDNFNSTYIQLQQSLGNLENSLNNMTCQTSTSIQNQRSSIGQNFTALKNNFNSFKQDSQVTSSQINNDINNFLIEKQSSYNTMSTSRNSILTAINSLSSELDGINSVYLSCPLYQQNSSIYQNSYGYILNGNRNSQSSMDNLYLSLNNFSDGSNMITVELRNLLDTSNYDLQQTTQEFQMKFNQFQNSLNQFDDYYQYQYSNLNCS